MGYIGGDYALFFFAVPKKEILVTSRALALYQDLSLVRTS
jgi:hypothetical protein